MKANIFIKSLGFILLIFVILSSCNNDDDASIGQDQVVINFLSNGIWETTSLVIDGAAQDLSTFTLDELVFSACEDSDAPCDGIQIVVTTIQGVPYTIVGKFTYTINEQGTKYIQNTVTTITNGDAVACTTSCVLEATIIESTNEMFRTEHTHPITGGFFAVTHEKK